MKRAYTHGLGALFFGALLCTAPAQTFFWEGVGTGWQGQVTPPNNGTANLFLGTNAINENITLPVNFSLNTIILATGTSDDTYEIKSAVSSTLLINDGIVATGTGNGRLEFDPTINIAGSGTLVLDSENAAIVIPGQITGSTALDLVSGITSTTNTSGAFIFNNQAAGNTYTGGTFISGITGSLVVTAFWNSSPFGTGPVSVFSGAQFIAHNTVTVANAFTFSTVTANDPIYFKSWDAPLTLSGPITLANNTAINAQISQHGVPSADNSGIWPTPGPASRNPIVFTGPISGAHTLTIGGGGVVILNPSTSNTYTGGTTVNGSLVFGNGAAIPSTGSIAINPGGYAGIADTTAGSFAAFLSHVSSTSLGAVGVDTLPSSSSPNIITDNINLTGFTNPSIRIGTATSAIIASDSTITPKGTDYQFGNGGGTLQVQSALYDVNEVTPSRVVLTDGNNAGLVSPLKVFLQGAPNYTGQTIANNGFIILDGPFLPSGTLAAKLDSNNSTGASYIGVTDYVDTSVSSFLASFDKTNTWGIVGLDTHPGDEVTAHFNDVIDLSSFHNGVYLGTATSAVIDNTSTVTPTADNILRLTAANGGTLTFNPNITGSTALVLGTPSLAWAYSNGTVILNGANTYTGGTTIDSLGSGITVQVGNAGALGTGALTLPQDVSAALQSSTAIVLPNPIVFQAPSPTDSPASLYITGSNQLELAGAITGPGSLNLLSQLTLSGNNSGFSGDINFVQQTYLYLNNNNAAGTGTVRFNRTGSSLIVGSSINPILYGISGDTGDSIQVNPGTVLTFDTSNSNNDHDFGGYIGSEGPVNASLVITASVGGSGLYLHGNNAYTGGTTITNYGAVALGNNNALGTGMVTLNASHGAVVLNDGITFSNPLTFTSGALMGFGTFAPSNLTSITIDASKAVIPGLFYVFDQNLPGALTFSTNMVFANGGNFYWSLQDVGRSDGYSLLKISGNLNITATLGGFTIDVVTIDATDRQGIANLVAGTPYTFTIAQTTGTITGFNAAAFTVDGSQFQNSLLTLTNVSVTADSNHLYLNFTAVPEPSTWALLVTGASVLGLTAFRRRRA